LQLDGVQFIAIAWWELREELTDLGGTHGMEIAIARRIADDAHSACGPTSRWPWTIEADTAALFGVP
jgi:hypothetical protein